MLDRLINFLLWIQKSDSAKKWIDRIFSFLVLAIATTYIWRAIRRVFWQCHSYYGRYYGDYYGGYYGNYGRSSYWNCESLLPGDSFLEVTLGAFLLVAIGASILYGVWKKFRQNEYSILRLLFNTTLPFFVGIIFLSAHIEYGSRAFSQIPWYLYILVGIYAFSPVVQFLRDNYTGEGLYKKILIWFNCGVMALKITFAVYIILGGILFSLFWLFLGDSYGSILSFFNYFVLLFIFIWMMLSYGWDEVQPIDERGIFNIRKGAAGLAILLIIAWGGPLWVQTIIENRIDTANSILREYGETSEGYKKAASVWGLKWAMKDRYLENRLYQKDLYAKIFDKTIESEVDEEIDVNSYRARNSNGTSMLARGENAKVELNFAKHESEIKNDVGVMETTVTYEFQNTDTQNQEVIYSIELPSSESVVTDLRLGLNLELTGTLAPRGAAEKVYTDSLRRNTDPALLEQTGPTTYRLRVFPVASKSDSRTQGRQRVAFRYITPITSGENISVMPKTDILNLKLTKKSEIMTRVMEGTKALHQDSFKTSDIDDLIAGKNVSVKIEGALKDSLSYCAINSYEGIDMKSIKGAEKNLTKNIVFLDISKSAGANKETRKRYQELIDAWKNNGAALDIYTFNTLVTSAGYDLSDIDFWGNTNMAAVISYIKNNGIENANIVILTDDDAYEPALAEDKSIDYKKIKTNRISLIQIGDKIRTLKTEVTKAILASEGDVLRLAKGASLDEGIKSIFTPKKRSENCESYNGENQTILSAVEGGRDGKIIYGENAVGTKRQFKGAIYPRYLYKNSHFSKTKDSEYSFNVDFTDVKNGKPVTLYLYPKNGYGDMLAPSRVDSSIQIIQEEANYVVSGGVLEKVSSSAPINYYEEITTNLGHEGILEKIGQKSHIVNQSMSLIALENDRQRSDLERYSNQNDKYDTNYQNFDNSQSSQGWSRREAVPLSNISSDLVELSSLDAVSTPSSSRGNRAEMFGLTSKSSPMSLSSSNSIGGSAGALSLGLSSGGSGGGIFQFLGILIFIPGVLWYFMRRKKMKETTPPQGEEKNPE